MTKASSSSSWLTFAWATTIVTSNLTSLLTIITMAMTIHVVVRYRELYAGNPEMSNRELVFATGSSASGVSCSSLFVHE